MKGSLLMNTSNLFAEACPNSLFSLSGNFGPNSMDSLNYCLLHLLIANTHVYISFAIQSWYCVFLLLLWDVLIKQICFLFTFPWFVFVPLQRSIGINSFWHEEDLMRNSLNIKGSLNSREIWIKPFFCVCKNCDKVTVKLLCLDAGYEVFYLNFTQ